jgi:hypothetical protein
MAKNLSIYAKLTEIKNQESEETTIEKRELKQ